MINKIYNTKIQWHDDDAVVDNYHIAVGEYDDSVTDEVDNTIGFYAGTEDEFNELKSPNNTLADFHIIEVHGEVEQ